MAEMNPDRVIQAKVEVPKSSQLHATRAVPKQDYCAYVYLIALEPKDNVHGIIKVLCTGESIKECEQIIAAMFNSNELEHHLNFIRIAPTGSWRYLIPGGEPTAEKDVFNIQTGSTTANFGKEVDERRRKQNRELKEKVELLIKESEEAVEDDPNSYETYMFQRVKNTGANQQIQELKKEKKRMEKLAKDSSNKLTRLESEFPEYKQRFESRKD